MSKNTVTAIFSNGYEDTYKGTRPVKAAWMITEKATGEVLASGHSLDVEKARKTAEGNVAYCISSDLPRYTIPNSAVHLHGTWAKGLAATLRDHGHDLSGRITAQRLFMLAKEANAQRKADQRSKVEIEVIDLAAH